MLRIFLRDLGDVQIPLLATMLLGGCLTKALKAIRTRSVNAGLGPTALFPLKLRRPAAMAMCATELGLGIGLILTAGDYLRSVAPLVRMGTGLLFLVATCSLIELRSVRPDIGCGCFGDFSKSPVTGRTIARSALLAAAALGTIRLKPIQPPGSARSILAMLLILAAELIVFAVLSPEIKDVLVRVGYSAPCELRIVSQEQTIAALQRSAQWRKHAGLIADQRPSDIWRELCWRYVAYPSKYAGKDADVVFAVRLDHRRPVILSALVDAATGAVLPWPVSPARPVRSRKRHAATRTRPARYPEPVRYPEPAGYVEPASLPGVPGTSRRKPYPPT
jgi:hypothetical protein